MIAPGVYDITCYAGATFDKTFTVTQDGSAVNLTGYTGRMQVRKTAGSATTLLDLPGDGTITITGATGTVAVAIPAASTVGLNGVYEYDLELVSGATVIRIVQGRFILSPEVTQ